MTDLDTINKDKKDYLEYKDKVSSAYLLQYIKDTRGRTARGNINCIYADTDPAHVKGTDNKPSMGYVKASGKYHCMTCNRVAGIYDFVKYDYKVDSDSDAFKILRDKYPTIPRFTFKEDTLGQNSTLTPVQPVKEIPNIEINTEYNFTDIINKANDIVMANDKKVSYIGSVAYSYYTKRGLTEDTIKRFKLGAVNDFNDLLVNYKDLQTKSKKSNYYKWVLPILDEQGNCYNFTAEIVNREQIDNYNQKYKKPSNSQGLTTILFNEYYLKTDKPSTIFITEGIYDALSIEQMGYKAIALMGIGTSRLIDLIKYYKPNTNLIVMLDNDTAGKTHANNLINELKSLNMQNIKYINGIDILYDFNKISNCKDSNEMLIKDKDSFKELLDKNIKIINTNEDTERIETAKTLNTLDYFRDITSQPPVKIVKTNFNLLDTNLKGGLRTGLYVLGALSSLGKTAFLLQTADQIAESGVPVLYFSLEMDKKELMARSIARITYKNDWQHKYASTTFEILDNVKYKNYSKEKKDLINHAINMYEKTANNLYIISGRYKQGNNSKRYDINDIEKTIKDFIAYTKLTPVIIIDYMQIIAPSDTRATDKQNMDEITDRLKQISIDYDTPVLAISSYNRDNYYEPANLSAFKESGSIEYGADVVMALQYNGIDEIYKDKSIKENEKKRKIYELIESIIESSKEGKDVPVQLKVLKARNSSKFNMVFNLNYPYGYFKESVVKADTPVKKASKIL